MPLYFTWYQHLDKHLGVLLYLGIKSRKLSFMMRSNLKLAIKMFLPKKKMKAKFKVICCKWFCNGNEKLIMNAQCLKWSTTPWRTWRFLFSNKSICQFNWNKKSVKNCGYFTELIMTRSAKDLFLCKWVIFSRLYPLKRQINSLIHKR